MVKILSGVITGAAISHEVGSMWTDFTKHSRVGHLYLAIDIFKHHPFKSILRPHGTAD